MPRHLTRPAAHAAAAAAVLVGAQLGTPAFAASHVPPPPTAPKKVSCPTVPAGAARTVHLAVQTLQGRLDVARTGTLWPVADAATWSALRAALAKAGVTTEANSTPTPSPGSPSAATPPAPSGSASGQAATPSSAASAHPSGSGGPSASTIATTTPSASATASASPGATPAPTGPAVDAATWAALGLGGAACPVEPKRGAHGPRTGVPDIDPGVIARTVKAMTPTAWPVIPATPPAAPTTNLLGRAAARSALAELGVPYKWGGTGIGGWDCSGLAQHAYASIGIALPRVTSTQIKAGQRIPLAQAHVGDLVFWATDPTDAWDVYHVGVYLGAGLIVEAPYTGAKVRITPLRTNALVGQVIRPTANLRWPVTPGTSSPTVRVLQRLLHVSITGTADAATVAAVQAAQQRAALPVTGTADELLAAWLAMGDRAGDGGHTAAELVLARLAPKMARVPGTGPATAKLPKPKPKPTAKPPASASPSAGASASASASPTPSAAAPASASASPAPKTSASPSPSPSAHH